MYCCQFKSLSPNVIDYDFYHCPQQLFFNEKLNNLLKECDAKSEVILLGNFNVHWSDKAKRKKL